MAISKAQGLAVLKYRAKAYDRLSTDIPKGKRDAYNLAASELGLSLSKLIQNGVEEFIARHAATDTESPAQVAAEKLSADDRRLVEEFAKLPADAQKHFLKAFAAVNSSKGGGGNGNE